MALFAQLNRTQMLHGREGGARVLLPTGGRTILRLDGVPTLGSPEAPYVMYHFFDYTDPFSRACHVALRDARRRYGDQIVVLALPWPLDATLNPHVPATVAAKHPGAGDYARLAYAVWRADRQQFEQFHDYLLAPPDTDQAGLTEFRGSLPSLEEARITAGKMVGAEVLQQALADPLLDVQIRICIDARPSEEDLAPSIRYAPATTWLRYREDDGVYEGQGVVGTMSSAWLFEAIESYWGIKPLHANVSRDDPIMQLLD